MMNNWFKLSPKERLEIINQVGASTGLPPAAIEKDLWVMFCLQAIYSTDCAPHIVFKGGTSLSKSWQVINRFSEDIDLAIDRSYFGYEVTISNNKIKKLRKDSCSFVSDKLPDMLIKQFDKLGIKEYKIEIAKFEESDTDPLALYVNFESAVDTDVYIKPRVIIELSSRSLREPFENRELVSLIGQEYPDKDFADKPITVPTVTPTRTFLEKIFLLHEEFQKPKEKIKSARMSRHLYDISRLIDTKYSETAFENRELYDTIISHRKLFTPVRGIDYAKHEPSQINFIPPDSIIDEWRKDYKLMEESMFYGETESFDDLIAKLTKLQTRINSW